MCFPEFLVSQPEQIRPKNRKQRGSEKNNHTWDLTRMVSESAAPYSLKETKRPIFERANEQTSVRCPARGSRVAAWARVSQI